MSLSRSKHFDKPTDRLTSKRLKSRKREVTFELHSILKKQIMERQNNLKIINIIDYKIF